MRHSRQDKETEVEETPATSLAAIQAPPKEIVVEETPATSQAAIPAPAPCITGEQADEAGITWVRICPGTFIMGSAENDSQARSDEKPAHQVTLSEFWLGKTEVTNKQYRLFQPTRRGEDNLPATVGWIDATAACKRFGGRLPTEAEWEYAARADSQTAWSFGDDEKHLGEYAWYGEGSAGKPHPAGLKKPNDWGLYDMHGNVWEWVEDWYGPYDGAAQVDPSGPQAGESRVVRGGAFLVPSRYLRSADRASSLPSYWVRVLGFRCARDPRRQP
jgi:formylglycine-generating enzyme required for sulfatase activity